MTFSLAECTISFFGIIFDGFATDKALSMEKVSEDYTVEEGCDGTTTRVSTNSRLWIARLSLAAGSPHNQKMTALWQAAQLVPGGIAGPFLLKDNLGADAVFCPTGFISKPPSAEWGNKPGSREWQIHLPDCVVNFGGASAPLLVMPSIPGL